MTKIIITFFFLLFSTFSFAGNQKYENMKQETINVLKQSVSDSKPEVNSFESNLEKQKWLINVGDKIKIYVPEKMYRDELLTSIHYEATRAGLDPYLILGLIYVESRFNKYVISSAGARGLMQIMPFWVDIIGESSHNVFYIRTNLRYGCTILRHYMELENGNIFRALARYNGSLGKDDYPTKVLKAKKWFLE